MIIFFVTGQVQAQIPLSTLDCDAKKTPFVTLLEHVALECRDGHWQVQRLRRLAMPHGFEYAAVLAPGMDLCVAAREPLGIVYDSVRSVAVAEEKESSAKSNSCTLAIEAMSGWVKRSW